MKSPLVRLVEVEERWGSQAFLPLNWGETERKSVLSPAWYWYSKLRLPTCVKIIVLSLEEFRGHRSDFVRQEQWTREGTHVRKTGSGATRKTTRRKDRMIMRQALVEPTVNRSTIRADVGVAQLFHKPFPDTLQIQAPFPRTPFNTGTSATASTVVPSQINVKCQRLAKGWV
ncbi:uncharacterized protein TNCV_1943631 [Trichonephila clavipes]|nr:uncharacterized protein TNCV_1943631 [Trichonephila clavipes]